MLKNLFKFIAVIVVIIAAGTAYFYFQNIEFRMQAKVFLKSVKIQAALAKLMADQTCSDELKKVECYDHFIRVTSGIEFSTDLALFSVGAFRVCYKNPYCVMGINERMVAQFDPKNLWVATERDEDPQFFGEAIKLEKGLINRYLRGLRQHATENYTGEFDHAKKLEILNYIKIIDSKIIELSKFE